MSKTTAADSQTQLGKFKQAAPTTSIYRNEGGERKSSKHGTITVDTPSSSKNNVNEPLITSNVPLITAPDSTMKNHNTNFKAFRVISGVTKTVVVAQHKVKKESLADGHSTIKTSTVTESKTINPGKFNDKSPISSKDPPFIDIRSRNQALDEAHLTRNTITVPDSKMTFNYKSSNSSKVPALQVEPNIPKKHNNKFRIASRVALPTWRGRDKSLPEAWDTAAVAGKIEITDGQLTKIIRQGEAFSKPGVKISGIDDTSALQVEPNIPKKHNNKFIIASRVALPTWKGRDKSLPEAWDTAAVAGKIEITDGQSTKIIRQGEAFSKQWVNISGIDDIFEKNSSNGTTVHLPEDAGGSDSTTRANSGQTMEHIELLLNLLKELKATGRNTSDIIYELTHQITPRELISVMLDYKKDLSTNSFERNSPTQNQEQPSQENAEEESAQELTSDDPIESEETNSLTPTITSATEQSTPRSVQLSLKASVIHTVEAKPAKRVTIIASATKEERRLQRLEERKARTDAMQSGTKKKKRKKRTSKQKKLRKCRVGPTSTLRSELPSTSSSSLTRDKTNTTASSSESSLSQDSESTFFDDYNSHAKPDKRIKKQRTYQQTGRLKGTFAIPCFSDETIDIVENEYILEQQSEDGSSSSTKRHETQKNTGDFKGNTGDCMKEGQLLESFSQRNYKAYSPLPSLEAYLDNDVKKANDAHGRCNGCTNDIAFKDANPSQHTQLPNDALPPPADIYQLMDANNQFVNCQNYETKHTLSGCNMLTESQSEHIEREREEHTFATWSNSDSMVTPQYSSVHADLLTSLYEDNLGYGIPPHLNLQAKPLDTEKYDWFADLIRAKLRENQPYLTNEPSGTADRMSIPFTDHNKELISFNAEQEARPYISSEQYVTSHQELTSPHHYSPKDISSKDVCQSKLSGVNAKEIKIINDVGASKEETAVNLTDAGLMSSQMFILQEILSQNPPKESENDKARNQCAMNGKKTNSVVLTTLPLDSLPNWLHPPDRIQNQPKETNRKQLDFGKRDDSEMDTLYANTQGTTHGHKSIDAFTDPIELGPNLNKVRQEVPWETTKPWQRKSSEHLPKRSENILTNQTVIWHENKDVEDIYIRTYARVLDAMASSTLLKRTCSHDLIKRGSSGSGVGSGIGEMLAFPNIYKSSGEEEINDINSCICHRSTQMRGEQPRRLASKQDNRYSFGISAKDKNYLTNIKAGNKAKQSENGYLEEKYSGFKNGFGTFSRIHTTQPRAKFAVPRMPAIYNGMTKVEKQRYLAAADNEAYQKLRTDTISDSLEERGNAILPLNDDRFRLSKSNEVPQKKADRHKSAVLKKETVTKYLDSRQSKTATSASAGASKTVRHAHGLQCKVVDDRLDSLTIIPIPVGRLREPAKHADSELFNVSVVNSDLTISMDRKHNNPHNRRAKNLQVGVTYPGTATSATPSPFQAPRARFKAGLAQIQSQHNTDFLPNLPRPPLHTSW